MTAHEHAACLWDKAVKQGLDAPTEGMIADAINDAMDNAFDACVNELRMVELYNSVSFLERQRKFMYHGERVLFKRP